MVFSLQRQKGIAGMESLSGRVARLTLGNQVATARDTRAAITLTLLCGLATCALLPIASHPGPVMPGFMLFHDSAMIAAFGMSAWVLYSHYRRTPSLNLLIAATGTSFTAAIIALQLLSLPGVFSPPDTRLLGPSSETTTWLWILWHVGPPAWGLA